MRIGASLVLIALGAILKWAVTGHVTGLSLPTVGVILWSSVQLVLSLVLLFTRRRSDVIQEGGGGYADSRGIVPGRSRTTYVEPNSYDDPRLQ